MLFSVLVKLRGSGVSGTGVSLGIKVYVGVIVGVGVWLGIVVDVIVLIGMLVRVNVGGLLL
jgi:hypothetical protein